MSAFGGDSGLVGDVSGMVVSWTYADEEEDEQQRMTVGLAHMTFEIMSVRYKWKVSWVARATSNFKHCLYNFTYTIMKWNDLDYNSTYVYCTSIQCVCHSISALNDLVIRVHDTIRWMHSLPTMLHVPSLKHCHICVTSYCTRTMVRCFIPPTSLLLPRLFNSSYLRAALALSFFRVKDDESSCFGLVLSTQNYQFVVWFCSMRTPWWPMPHQYITQTRSLMCTCNLHQPASICPT